MDGPVASAVKGWEAACESARSEKNEGLVYPSEVYPTCSGKTLSIELYVAKLCKISSWNKQTRNAR